MTPQARANNEQKIPIQGELEREKTEVEILNQGPIKLNELPFYRRDECKKTSFTKSTTIDYTLIPTASIQNNNSSGGLPRNDAQSAQEARQWLQTALNVDNKKNEHTDDEEFPSQHEIAIMIDTTARE